MRTTLLALIFFSACKPAIPQALRWADSETRGLCVSVISGRSIESVLTALDIPFGAGTQRTFAEALELETDALQPVQVFTMGAQVVVLEPNGFWASDAEHLLTLAGRAQAVSAYWNTSASMAFNVARGGVAVRSFDPLFMPEDKGEGTPLPEEARLPFGEKHAHASSLALIDRLTDVRLTRAVVVEQQHATWLREAN